ncbi:conserved protein of unknown function [Candidatus Filomicrobium marinum]|uniref:Uncharacterized protein n=2 Tax=Filomicrobium TaxID=119044 RepID=A0A0D6JKI0_9HYPH|nr:MULTISPECIES: hypothetical protein [Filomicrobium]CFX61733.1 conserved protein of unknown function [Candidatus Filomicrobium marinum]CPR22474.1 conserved protein of unknown function [Candidatus Filomicrobium marinum]SDO83323.1 hypothetical protein SAMN04488061_1773 [Filomicrobium insigne]
MPPLILLAVAGLGAYAGYRLVRSGVHKSINRSSFPSDVAEAEPRDMGALERDPASGIYRPRH